MATRKIKGIKNQEEYEVVQDILMRLGWAILNPNDRQINTKGFEEPNGTFWAKRQSGIVLLGNEKIYCADDCFEYLSSENDEGEEIGTTYITTEQFFKWANAELKKRKKKKTASKLISFGFEIECETTSISRNLLKTMGSLKGDGSIDPCRHRTMLPQENEFHKKHDEKNANDRWEARELATRVFNIDQLAEVESFFGRLQTLSDKGLYHFNRSMGFHIHLGFEPKRPPELISLQFVKHFLKETRKAFPDAYNLRKANRFCRIRTTEKELASFNADRYKAVNIVGAQQSHRTIEIRLFPSEEPKKMLKYLKFTLKLVKAFLKTEIKKRIVAYNILKYENRTYVLDGEKINEDKKMFIAELEGVQKVIYSA